MRPDPLALTLLLTGSLLPVTGAEDGVLAPRTRLETPPQPERSKTHVGVSTRLGFNISVNLRSLRPLPQDASAGPAVARTYGDGFVGVDSSGNAGGKTWFWGYQNASQHDPSGLGSIAMTHTSHSEMRRESGSGELHPGAEVFVARDLVEIGLGRVGLEAGFNYLHLHSRDRTRSTRPLSLTTDRYSLDGFGPPPAPYSGTYEGPGVLLEATPFSRTFATEEGLIEVDHEVDAQVLGLRFGPYLDIPMKQFSLRLDAGISVAIIDSKFDFHETVTPAGGDPQRREAGNRETDLLYGPHAGLKATYWFHRHARAFLGLQYQNLGRFKQSDREVESGINFAESIYLMGGFGFTF